MEETVVVTSSTGGKCGTKKARPDLIPWAFLRDLGLRRERNLTASRAGVFDALILCLAERDTYRIRRALYAIDYLLGEERPHTITPGGFHPHTLYLLAGLYGAGADKYGANNWMKGYDEELSWAKLGRHMLKACMTEIDEESGCLHLICCLWHLIAILYFRSNYERGQTEEHGHEAASESRGVREELGQDLQAEAEADGDQGREDEEWSAT